MKDGNFKNKKLIGRAFLFSVMLGIMHGVNAQTVPQNAVRPLKSIEAGKFNTPEDTVNQGVKKYKNKQNIGEKLKIRTQQRDAESKAKYSEKTFELKGVEFNGNTVFKNSYLQKQVEDLIGVTVTIGDVHEIAREITQFYREKGYITSFAYLPPQTIGNGIVKIDIMEGKVGNVKVQGNKWAKESYIRKNIFAQKKVKEGKLFNVNYLKKAANKLNAPNYLKGNVKVVKGEVPETSDIILDVEDRVPITLSAGFDNMGIYYIGDYKANVTAGIENLTGYGDRLSATTFFTGGMFGVGTNYALPLGSKGTELRLGYNFTKVKLLKDLKPANIKTDSQNYHIGLFQPLLEGQTYSLTSDIGFDFRHSNGTIMGQTLSGNKYDLRVLRTGLNLAKDDYYGKWLSRVELSAGLPIFGASDTDNTVAKSAFTKLTTNLMRLQNLPLGMLGVFRFNTQLASDPLRPIEKMALGGAYTVRGYEESLLTGDQGYSMSAELRTPIYFLPQINENIRLRDRIRFITFYDMGYAKDRRDSRDSANFRNYLQSAGFGLNYAFTKYLAGNVNFAFPFGEKRDIRQDSMKVHFSLSSNIF